MLHPSISRNGVTVNGIYPNQFGTGNEQVDPTSFRTNQGDTVLISHSESFSLRAYLKGTSAATVGISVNTQNAQASDIVEQNGTALTLADGVLTFDGTADADITIGVAGKPLIGNGLFTVYNFLPIIGKAHSFVLSLSKNKGLYLITIQASSITIQAWSSSTSAWVVAQTITNPQAFTASDIVSFRISNEKVDVEIGNTSVWNKPRTWSITLSSPDLGKLATVVDTVTIDPTAIPFGKAIPLVIGSKSGNYSLSVANQEGSTFSVAQAIEVSVDSAVSVSTNGDEQTLIQTLLLANLAKKDSAGAVIPVTAVETTDWRKIMTWGGVGLAGILILAALFSAFRK